MVVVGLPRGQHGWELPAAGRGASPPVAGTFSRPLHVAPDLGTPPAFLMPGGSESAFPVERHLWTPGVRGRCDPPL